VVLGSPYEQRVYESGVPEGVLRSYAVEPLSRRRGFYQGISEVRRTHPYGAAVEVKDPTFYSDPTTTTKQQSVNNQTQKD